MAINETIVTGRKFRKLIDEATKLWQRISFWTKASDVEFDDGQTAENKMGAINGITSDISGESENVAASIKLVNQLYTQLNSDMQTVMAKVFPATLNLYNLGDECIDVTGGWVGTASGGTTTKNSNYLYATLTSMQGPNNSYHAQFYTDLQVDVSDYNYLCIDGYYTGQGGFAFLANNKANMTYGSKNATAIKSVFPPLTTRGIRQIDISDLSGQYYIGLTAIYTGTNYQPGKLYCNRLWLSK